MFKFFFKKNFCDIWDNLFYGVITNFFSLVILFGLTFIYNMITAFGEVMGLKTIFSSLAVFLCCIVFFGFSIAYSKNAREIANFDSPRYGLFFHNIFRDFGFGALYGVATGFFVCVARTSIPYYIRCMSAYDGTPLKYIWALFIILIVWIIFFALLASQWLFAVRVIMGNGFIKCVKKACIITLDNMKFSLALLLVNFLNLVVTVLLFGLLPGTGGIILTNVNALRLILYKYDWLEVNQGLTYEERKDVPWDDLLRKDRKIVGPRPFKSFFLPWKN